MDKQQRIEWLISEAQQEFNNSSVNRESCTFSYEVIESDCTSLTFLHIFKKANQNTGALFMFNKTYLITLCKRGAIRDAREIHSNRNVARYVKRGIFSL